VKKSLLIGLAVLAISMSVIAQPVMVSPDLWNWHVVQDEPSVNYPVLAIARVIDGDTFEAWLLIAPRLAYFADVRLFGVDTPEITGACGEQGKRVKNAVEQFLASASTITVNLIEFDKYGRWICSVDVDGVSLTDWIRAHHLTKEELCQPPS